MTWASFSDRTKTSALSPLFLLVRDERTNRLLARIAQHLDDLRSGDLSGHPTDDLVLSCQDLEYARAQWDLGVRLGEQRLYDLAELMAIAVTGTNHLQRVARVVAGPKGEQEGTAPRLVIEQTVSREDLITTTDYGLAGSIASRFRYRPGEDDAYVKLYARASFVELRPLETIEGRPAMRVLTRVKANDAIWNKVCDAMFDVDSIILRDKILNPQSKYIKDVFGIKVLTPDREACYEVERQLGSLRFEVPALDHLGIDVPGSDRLELVERKDYLRPSSVRKSTGWEAIKNVYIWCGHLFEIQFQTEANYFLEVGDLSKTSHRTFEMQRRRLRRQLEDRVPHYREFRRLLKAIFSQDRQDRSELGSMEWVRLVA